MTVANEQAGSLLFMAEYISKKAQENGIHERGIVTQHRDEYTKYYTWTSPNFVIDFYCQYGQWHVYTPSGTGSGDNLLTAIKNMR